MGAVYSGKVTLVGTGAKSLYMGIPWTHAFFYAGAQDTVVETVALFATGHADAAKQFCHTLPKSETSQTKAMKLKDAAGNVVLEFTVTGGYGTSFMNINVTTTDGLHPIELVAME